MPIAYAGPDQTCKVGQYVILDASRSTVSRGGKITWYEWTQDENNPMKVNLLSGEDDVKPIVGFIKEGFYKFTLKVKDENLISQSDEVLVRVYPRDNYIFEDPNLEIDVRYHLREPTIELTETTLMLIDSINHSSRSPEDITTLNGIEKCINLKYLNMTLDGAVKSQLVLPSQINCSLTKEIR